MKINDLIKAVAKLVEEREIIDHGSIRCIYSDQAVSEIESAEGCEEVDTGTIGDDDLASELDDLSDDGEAIGELDFDDLVALEYAYRGHSIADYIDDEKEDELQCLDSLIERAKVLV